MCNLYRGPSIDTTYQVSVHLVKVILEEKIKMWKVNGRQTTDAKWWQKLTLSLARWANNWLALIQDSMSEWGDHLTCRRGSMVFCIVQKFFFGQHELDLFFFQNLTLGYMTKTLNQIFFSSTKIRIFFLEKKHNPSS